MTRTSKLAWMNIAAQACCMALGLYYGVYSFASFGAALGAMVYMWKDTENSTEGGEVKYIVGILFLLVSGCSSEYPVISHGSYGLNRHEDPEAQCRALFKCSGATGYFGINHSYMIHPDGSKEMMGQGDAADGPHLNGKSCSLSDAFWVTFEELPVALAWCQIGRDEQIKRKLSRTLKDR